METLLHFFDFFPTWFLVLVGVVILVGVALRILAARGQKIYAKKLSIVGYRHTIWVNAVDESKPVQIVTQFPIPALQLNGDELKIVAKDDSIVIIRPSRILLADINNPIYGISHEQ